MENHVAQILIEDVCILLFGILGIETIDEALFSLRRGQYEFGQ
jgi:hypothetical protein